MSAIIGKDWTNQLYFDPEADESQGSHHWISHGELRAELKRLVDSRETILQVTIYRHPLNCAQLTDDNLYHPFVVLETDGWWWSIEKNVQQFSYFFSYLLGLINLKCIYRRNVSLSNVQRSPQAFKIITAEQYNI